MSLHIKLAKTFLTSVEHFFKDIAHESHQHASDEWKKVLEAIKGHAEEKIEAMGEKALEKAGDHFHLQDHQKMNNPPENPNKHQALEFTGKVEPEDKPLDIPPTGQTSESPAAQENVSGSETEALDAEEAESASKDAKFREDEEIIPNSDELSDSSKS